VAKAERALVHADSSALVKLVAEERESPALRRFTEQADLVSCELALAEIPRAIRRAAAGEPRRLRRAPGRGPRGWRACARWHPGLSDH
jgi:predicted nucleic acid-binding protein